MSRQESARIPRRKSEGLLEEVKFNSPEGQSILADVKRTCFDTNYEDKFWKIEKIEIVSNFVLEKRYEDKKRELKEQGRKGKEMEEHLMFLSEQRHTLSTVVKDGCKTGTKKRHVLGYTKSGVHLNRNLDILVRFMTFKNFSSPGHIIVFKSILGRSKALKPMDKSAGATYIEPTPNCDSHVSSEKVQPTMSICEALNYTYVYFYEYDEDTGLPVVYPRQVVPYAVLTMCRLPGVNHGGPFLAIESPNWRWEVKGETRNGFRWARVNADSPDSDAKVTRGKGKKKERSMPSKDIASLEVDHMTINIECKGQSVAKRIKKEESSKDSQSCNLTNVVLAPVEGVCIPVEEKEISGLSCYLSKAIQLPKTEKKSFKRSKINDNERLIHAQRKRLSEIRCQRNNLGSDTDETVQRINDGSQNRFDRDNFVDKLSQQSSVVATLKTSEVDNKGKMDKEGKDQNSTESKDLKTIITKSPCEKVISLQRDASSLVSSPVKDCPGQKHTEERMKKTREVLLINGSIHTSALSTIPSALINPRVFLRRIDEDLVKSKLREHSRLVVGNNSLSTSVISEKAKEKDMSSPVEKDVHIAATSDSVNIQSNSNTEPPSSTKKSREQVGIFHSSTQLPCEQGRFETSASIFVSPETSYVVGQLQKPPSKESFIPQNECQPSTLANRKNETLSCVTYASKTDKTETCIKEDTVGKGGESLSSVCTKKTDTDIQSHTSKSRNVQTNCDDISPTPASIETRMPTGQDSSGFSTMENGQNSHHRGSNHPHNMHTTQCHVTGIKYDSKAQFNGPSPFQEKKSLFRSTYLPQCASIENRIPRNMDSSLIREHCTDSGKKNIYTHSESKTLHTAHENVIPGMKNPVSSNLPSSEGKKDNTQGTTSSISSLCTVAGKTIPVVCNNSKILSELQAPTFTKSNIGIVSSPNQDHTNQDQQSADSINNRQIVPTGYVSTFDRYIIEKAWKQLGNIKLTSEANTSDNEIPRTLFCVDKDSYPQISETANPKVSKDPRLRPRVEMHFKDTSNNFSHEKIDTEKTSKRDGNLSELNSDKVSDTSAFNQFKKGNETYHQAQTRGSDEEMSDGTPTYDERDYSAGSDLLQAVGHENHGTIPIKPKETVTDSVKNMGLCTVTRANESVIVDTKRIDDSQQNLLTPIKDLRKKSMSNNFKEKASDKKVQLNSNSSKPETKGFQSSHYQVEITKTLLELSAIVNEIQSRQRQASQAKDAKSPILGDVTAGQSVDRRDESATEERLCRGNKDTSDGSTRASSDRGRVYITNIVGRKDSTNFESISPIDSRCNINAHCTNSTILAGMDIKNPGTRAKKSSSLGRRHKERTIKKYQLLNSSDKNDNAAIRTPENTLQSNSKKVDIQVSFEYVIPSPSKDQCISSNGTVVQTILHKTDIFMGSEKGANTAKEKMQIKSAVASIEASETQKQCTGVTVETCSTVMNQLQNKMFGSNISTAMKPEENVQREKGTKSLDMTHKWRPIAPVEDSKSQETEFSGAPLGKCQSQITSSNKPSTNRNRKVRVDRKSNVKVEIVLKSKHFVKDTENDKTNSLHVLFPPENPGDSDTNGQSLNTQNKERKIMKFEYGETRSENSLKKVSGAGGNFKDIGTTYESNNTSKSMSDNRSKGHSVNHKRCTTDNDFKSEKETIHFSNKGVTTPSAIKELQCSSQVVDTGGWSKEGLLRSSTYASVENCKQCVGSALSNDKADSIARKPQGSDKSSKWKRTDVSAINKNDKQKATVSVYDSEDCLSDDSVSSDSESSSDYNKSFKKHESRSTNLSIGDVLKNGQVLNCCKENGGTTPSMRGEAKRISKLPVHAGDENNCRKKLNSSTSKTMDITKKRLNLSSAGLKDINISSQETSSRILMDGFANSGTKTKMSEKKAVDEVTKRNETQKVKNFQAKDKFEIYSSDEENQCVSERVSPERRFQVRNKGVKKHNFGWDGESPDRGSVHCKVRPETMGKSENSLKQRINIVSPGQGIDENGFSYKNNCKRRASFFASEKDNRETPTSTVTSSSLSSEDCDWNRKRRRLDDTKLERNSERETSVSSSERHSSVSPQYSRNSSLARSVSGSRNDRESCSQRDELSPIRYSGYIPPRYFKPNFILKKQSMKQRFIPFHKGSQKQWIEKQKVFFQKNKYTRNLGRKNREFYRNERRFVDFNNVDDREYVFQNARERNLPPKATGSKHHRNYVTDNGANFQTRACKSIVHLQSIVHLPDNDWRNSLENNLLSRKKISGEHTANRDDDNQSDYHQSTKPLVPNGGLGYFSKRHHYSNLNGRTHGFHSSRGFSLMRAKRTLDEDAEKKNLKKRKKHGFRVHVEKTKQTAIKKNGMKAKQKEKVSNYKYSRDDRSQDCEKRISVDNVPEEKSGIEINVMNNDIQSNKRRLEHSLYKDKFGALHERLDVRSSKQSGESGAKSKHLSNKDKNSNFDDAERSVRPRIRLRERIFDALERYRNAFESSDPSEVDEEIVRCLNFLCKKIDISGSDSDTSERVSRQRRHEKEHPTHSLRTSPQTVVNQRISFYEHIVNTIRIMQRRAAVTKRPNSVETVQNVMRDQFWQRKNLTTMKNQTPVHMKRKRSVMHNQLMEPQNQSSTKHQISLQRKRKANFDFNNTDFRHGGASFGKKRNLAKTK